MLAISETAAEAVTRIVTAHEAGEDAGIRITHTAALLDDKLLEAQVERGGLAGFAILEQG